MKPPHKIDREGPKYYDWSPDSSRFITATTRPLRTVDNGFKIWSYAGEQKRTEKIHQLYQASWLPAAEGTYPEKVMSPRLKGRKLKDFTAAAPKAYVPPSLRGRVGGSTLSKQLRAERAVSGPTRINPNSQPGGKNNDKNRKKRERRRRKAAEKASGATKATDGTATEPGIEPRKDPPAEAKKQPTEQEVILKKIKALKKKLRQITQLEEKDPGSLDEGQRKKLASKSNLERDVADFEEKLKSLQ